MSLGSYKWGEVLFNELKSGWGRLGEEVLFESVVFFW